jgi:hypothetical protein
MKTVFNLMFTPQCYITGIVLISMILSALRLFPGRNANSKELLVQAGVCIILAAIAYIAWYFKQQGRIGYGIIVLGIEWLSVLIGMLYAVSKARWN